MSYIELLQESPGLFVLALILSLVLTLLVYGAFPIVFAKIRKSAITKRKYKWLCFGINFLGIIFFTALNGAAASGGAYFLWTWIFSNRGAKMLEEKGLLSEQTKENTTDDKYEEFAEVLSNALEGAAERVEEIGPIIYEGQRPNEPDYGLSPSNPLLASSLAGVDTYLECLRTKDGRGFTWNRIGDTIADCNGAKDVSIDEYQLYLDGEPYKVLYFVLYIGESENPPAGFLFYESDAEDEPTEEVSTEIAEELPTETDAVSVAAIDRPQRARYCSKCGNLIDQETKKCTGCGKQYFKGVVFYLKCFFKSTKAVHITLSILLALSLCLNVVFAVSHSNNKKEIDKLLAKTYDDSETILEWKSQATEYKWLLNKANGKLDFYEDHVVFVSDDGTNLYHKYGCRDFDSSVFWAYNTAQAIDRGYVAHGACCD